MASSFAKDALKICIAQICQNIGWHAVQTCPMDILVDVLQRYIFEIAKSVHQYSIQYNRTEPNLDDLGLTFKDFGIALQEIEEYVNNVEPVPFTRKIAAFPVKHSSNLQHPKAESREIHTRPEHIPEYLPLMRPDLEEEDALFNQQNAVDGGKKTAVDSNTGGDSHSPFSSPKHGTKRPGDWAPDTPSKKPRYYSEEEGRPMREVTSVFMTAAGFISPVHEGKTAEASLPCLVDSPPPTPEFPSPSHSVVSVKKEVKNKDVKKDKSSKPKKDKEGKKDVKKVKSSKKEKENKENAVSKHEKAMTSSSSSGIKKDHSSHKSSKSEKNSKSDDGRQKVKSSDKAKIKARKEELHKMKESFKLIKLKSKMKHTGSSAASSLKSSKLSSSKKFKAARVTKPYKNLKGDKPKSAHSSPVKSPPVPFIPKEPPVEIKVPVIEPVPEKLIQEEPLDREELNFREESPESRLVIDDSLETQARQERESRLEVIDECIEAVIRRGEEESEVQVEKTHKAMDETINAVARGPPIMKKLEPKDIYDFTDTSNDSSLSSCDIAPPHSPVHLPPKKEKKTPEGKKSDSPKKNKNKEKQKKKSGKEPKAKSPSPYSPPKSQKQFVLKVDDRTPSPPPTLKDDLLSSDASTPSSSPSHNTFLEHSPQRQGHMPAPPLLSHMQSPLSSSFIPMPGSGAGYSSNPFTPMRSLPCHMQTPFPTPPLFVTPAKTESSASFQNMQPLNLAKSGPSSLKSSPDKTFESTSKTDNSNLIKQSISIMEKSKFKKEKNKKKGKKEGEKIKDKKDKEKDKDKDKEKDKDKDKDKEETKEKIKPKEKPKAKAEKNIKIDKRKSKPEKRKIKEKEEKVKEDSSVPKITMKLTSSTGSAKIFVKPNTKNSTPLSSSPSNSDEEENLPSPSPPPPRVPTPSPPREPTPPPPPSPSPPPPVKEPKEVTPPPVPPPPISTKSTPSRGRGRGRKAQAARTVITETVGTIVDESGNKIWICPACSGADDGSPMIGCDECDDWYHWVCVNIVVPPKEEENWFCVRCISKRQTPAVKRRRKKHKKEK